ncbi:hypothetical protein KKA14_11235, partial [bacterium]|nr:hypothetical protein [bacterium]
GAEIYEMNEITILSDSIVIELENILNADTLISEEEFKMLVQDLFELEDTFHHLQIHYLNNLVSDEQILDKTIYRVTKSKIEQIEREISENIIQKKMKTLENVFEKNYLPFTRLKTLEEITEKRLNSIKAHIKKNVVDSSLKEIVDLMASLRKQPVGLVLKRYAIIAVNLGERQKKRVEVELKGAEIEVPLHSLENLFTSLTYIIRNAVEHGLEPLNERMDSDKTLEGKISIEVSLEEGELKIIIADDGRGIDVDKIKQSALKKGVITEKEANSADDNEILRLLFKKGFSTKKDVGGTFGRGVGLSTVGSVVAELNGTIFVQTKPGKGSTFEISLPLPA